MELTIKQTMALDCMEDNITTELLFGGGAGGGKSAIGCYWLAKNCVKYPGSRWLMGRSELKSLKRTTLNTFFEICQMQKLRSGIHYTFNPNEGLINFVNGSQIVLQDLYSYPADPMFDSLGSLEITGAFIDECNQITDKAKNIVKSRIRYKLDQFGLIPKMLMTCNPAKNWVYYEFYQPYRTGDLPFNKRFIPALVTENKHVSHHYIANLQTLDTVSKERLLLGNWEYDDDPSALIPYDKILSAFERKDVPSGERHVTADIARFGKDKTTIGTWDGYRVRIQGHRKLSVPQSAEQIRLAQIRNQCTNSSTIVDEDGVGGGVVDILKCKGFVNNARPIPNKITGAAENFVNLKSQCYYELADLFNSGQIYIDCTDPEIKAELIQELEQVKQWNMDKDGKKAIMPKDKVKEILGRSPDWSDLLMMRMYFKLAPQRSWVIAV